MAANTRNVRIGDVLKEFGYIDDAGINQGLAYQKEHRGTRLGQALMQLGLVSESQVLEALSRRLDVPIMDVSTISVDIDAVRLVPEDIARMHMTLPVEKRNNVLTVLTNDPLNFFGLEEIRQITGLTLDVKLCASAPLERAIAYYYREANTYTQAEDASLAFAATADFVDLDIEASEDDAPIVALLNQLVHYAYSVGASDIHIEPFQDQTNMRIRVDGVLMDYLTVKRSVHAPLIARIKIVSNMDIAERYMPQDGHFRTLIAGESVNVRVNVMPSVYGEKAVLRLLSTNNTISHNTTFGMRQPDYEKFCQMLNVPNGIIYLTGPTGSGKTTTLYMVLAALATEEVNISTIEDPVERNLPRITQTQVNETAGLTFAEGLRALMRQDPDIIMLGETRDEETATIAVRAAITGHLVLSTLHTNDAASSVHRLIDMGVEPYMVGSSLAGVVAQRLVRKVCPECCEEHAATEAELEMLGLEPTERVMLKSPRGCPHCGNTGYKGRTAIHEILLVDREVRRMITEGATDQQIKDYAVREQGMKTLRDSGIECVLTGESTIEELMKIIYYV